MKPRPPRRRGSAQPLVAALLLSLAAVAACGGAAPILDPAKTSSIEAVPVPQSAVEDRSLGGDRQIAYRVAGVTFEELSAWYERELPDGEPFGQWAWCDGDISTVAHGRVYYRPGSTRVLLVTVAGGEAPGILVAWDDSGSC